MRLKSTPGSEANVGKQREFAALVGAVLLMFCFGIINSCIGYYVAPVSEELGVGRGMFNSHYTIMLGISLISSPILAKTVLPKIGAPLFVSIGAFICSLGLILFSFAHNIWEMFAVSVLVGSIQLTCTSIIAVSTVTQCFLQKTGLAIGIAMAGSGVNNLVMSAVLPTCIEKYSWRSGYRFQSILFLVLALFAALLIRGQATYEREDTSSAIVSANTNIRKTRLISLIFFNVAAFIVSLCTSFLTQLPAYLGDLNINVLSLSRIMSMASVALTISKVALGSLYDTIGKKQTIIFVLLLFSVSFLTLMIDNLTILAISSVTISIGMASSTVLPPLISKDVFGGSDYAAVWAVINAASQAGGAIGSVVWGAVYDLTGSYDIGIGIAPILLFCAMLIWVRQIRSISSI